MYVVFASAAGIDLIRPHLQLEFDDKFRLLDGLTPPARRIRKRRFRKQPKFDVRSSAHGEDGELLLIV